MKFGIDMGEYGNGSVNNLKLIDFQVMPLEKHLTIT